jgi:hypothetical protein
MAAVFSSAEKVVAWLGPASDNSDLFMAQVSRLNTIFAGITDPKAVTRQSWCDHGLPPVEDPLWLAFLKLSFRPWFTRLWVVQEVALARSAVFVCGEYEAELDEVMTFANHLGGIHFPILNDMVCTHNIRVPNTDHALASLPTMQAFRQALRNGQNITLLSLLMIARAKHATEPVDKIYGMLGLMSKSVRDKIVVDYSPDAKKRFWQLYIHTGYVLLEESGYLALAMAASEQRHPDLPTWCPDLRYGSPVIFDEMGSNFRAGITTSTDDMGRIPLPSIKMVGPDAIECCGLMMDRVKHLRELFIEGIIEGVSEYAPSRAQQVIDCEKGYLDLSQQTYGLQQRGAVPYQHIETLVMAMGADGSQYDEAQVTKDYHLWKEWYRIMAAQQRSSDRDMEAAADRYNAAACLAWEGHAFFTTECGRVGVGPEAMRPGDSVHVFFGARAPYILRFDTSKQAYTLVGQAFVAGLMDGDAFWARNPLSTFERFLLR